VNAHRHPIKPEWLAPLIARGGASATGALRYRLIGVPLALAARDNPGLAEFALITPTPRPGYAPTLLTSVPRSAEHDREKSTPAFRKDHAPARIESVRTIQP
jgi:hypothetical protein